MRFVHIADVHFGTAFAKFQGINNLTQKRQLALREAFDKIIEYIKSNNIEHLFIAGDLYEQETSNTAELSSALEYCIKKFIEANKRIKRRIEWKK